MPRIAQHLLLGRAAFVPALVIFDKGGTLLDFRAMWGEWAADMAQRLAARSSSAVAGRFCEMLGFDPRSGEIDPAGKLAALPMAELRTLTVDVLIEAGLTRHAAEAAVATVWRVPDPITSARPLADLTALFRVLRARGIKIAIATMDDRASSQAGLAALGVVSYVEALVCADDGWPPKPAPEMAWAACRSTGVMPSQAVVVGDSMSDMQMGRRAGAGLVVGVLSGVSPAELLAPHADALLYSVVDLV
jgi:phosphoglycolate phosphatase